MTWLCHYMRHHIMNGGDNLTYTKEEFYEEIKRLYDTYGRTDKYTFQEHGILQCNYHHYCTKYGGIKKICYDLIIPFVNIKRIDPNLIKEDFIRVYKDNGEINTNIYEKYGKYSKEAIRTAFGCIGNLMSEIGIDTTVRNKTQKCDVIDDFIKTYQITNSTYRKDYLAYGKYSYSLICRLFGSWSELLREVGLEVNKDRYGLDKMLSSIHLVYLRHGFLSKELINKECEFSYQAVRRYFANVKGIEDALGISNAFVSPISSGAIAVEQAIQSIYPTYDKEKTWSWLVNPETNKHLYVDFYIAETNTAVEYDGQQHFSECYFFKIDSEALEKYQQRDAIKDELLKQHQVNLIRIKYSDDISVNAIAYALKNNGK